MIIPYICWTLYCILDGITDGFFYHLKDVNKKSKINEHILFSARRICVGVFFASNSTNPIYSMGIYLLSQSFFHNNAYYNTRHFLDKRVYGYGLDQHSTTSTAWTTKILDPGTRFWLLICGVLLYTYITGV